MTTGLATTIETLSASRNDATNALLLAALENTKGPTFDAALKAIIARRHKAGHVAVLQRWHRLQPAQRELLQEGRGRMSSALRDAVLSEEDQLFENACELVEHFQEFDLVPALVTLAENKKSNHAEAATSLVLRLGQQLSEAVHGPRDYSQRRDPQSLARFVLESLERSVERYRTHGRDELIEAFVVLSGPSSPVLLKILDEPHHPCYLTVIDTLTTSKSTGVIQLLLRALQNDAAPLTVLKVISKRDDPEFIAQLLDLVEEKIPAKMAKNLARIRSFSWMQEGERGYNSFTAEEQAKCIKLVAASGVNPDQFLDLVENLLEHGTSEVRCAACDALASIPGDRGNHLVLDVIDDHDPNVQAAATRQIRDRHVPGAMSILMRKIDSPHEVVRQATSVALAEFTFANYLAGFESLQDEPRQSMGALVKKVDPETINGLFAEMNAKSRKRRLRAIEMTTVMELAHPLCEGLLILLEDEDHIVRSAAAEALQHCPTGEVQQALRRAANDRSASVRSAAQYSLEVFDEIGASGYDGNLPSTEARQ